MRPWPLPAGDVRAALRRLLATLGAVLPVRTVLRSDCARDKAVATHEPCTRSTIRYLPSFTDLAELDGGRDASALITGWAVWRWLGSYLGCKCEPLFA